MQYIGQNQQQVLCRAVPPSLVSWPLQVAPVPVEFPSAECHILGCIVHSSHMLISDHQQSKAAECHPAGNQRKNRFRKRTPQTQMHPLNCLIKMLTCYYCIGVNDTSWITNETRLTIYRDMSHLVGAFSHTVGKVWMETACDLLHPILLGCLADSTQPHVWLNRFKQTPQTPNSHGAWKEKNPNGWKMIVIKTVWLQEIIHESYGHKTQLA